MNPSDVDALAMSIPLEPVSAEQVVAGSPQTGFVMLEERDGTDIGVWEHTVGTSTDVEADEWFAVLAGEATVTFEGTRPPLELRPGVVARLASGDRTVWEVRVTLRKLFVSL